MHVEINEQLRNEIFLALADRQATIAGHAKKLKVDGMPAEAAMCERRLALYSTSGAVVGLLPMFADQTDLDEERVKRGEERDPEGQQDIFGGGAETGAGTPAGQIDFLDARGNPHPTQTDADAADAAQRELDGDGLAEAADNAGEGEGIPQPGVIPFRALNAGDSTSGDDDEPVEAHALDVSDAGHDDGETWVDGSPIR